MPPHPSAIQNSIEKHHITFVPYRLHCGHLAQGVGTPFLKATTCTIQSLLESAETIRQNKAECTPLMEQTREVLDAIIGLHIKSDTTGELSPKVLNDIGKFTETLHKIYVFVEAQQDRNPIKQFFRHGEMNKLVKDSVSRLDDLAIVEEEAKKTHQEVLDLIDSFSDGTNSDRGSSISVLDMGSTASLFLATHFQPTLNWPHSLERIWGPSTNLTRAVVRHFANSPPYLLILDNLETLWEPRESQGDVEEFLSLLTDINHLALIITKRGAERPAKVAWTRSFLQPLQPLAQEAARQTFIDIADDVHDIEDIDGHFLLAGNMPLAIDLIAHLADSEGCSYVFSHWEEEKTSLVSDGYDRRSNLDLSIALSLSIPRVIGSPESKELLSLLAMLPDAYTDDQKRLKTLAPIQQYMQKFDLPNNQLLQPLLEYFEELLEFENNYYGTVLNPSTVARITMVPVT
ncbi:hypothetical protein B0H19DRAFT_1080501 [Mycena capillaripes]|nr:hypothetical protein B0H19DRAFT_1080501 [Mycena capillaripes]